ncbi:MAG: bifunctional phosphopantothenoylcysteine decarboxylase/phosphopantothenate--cysteine ligase CoaBC, partial [Mariprofundaceae bacterium]|nr:bifunctional phosphopantothenoylcysteine decarboxylase/phosphopantothenate--cysteine ligase CoaBC [Mariprofundaceae bacterium]
VLLAVSGGIAAYRAAELARLLIRQGAEVRCVMTRGACEFITPLTFEALTGQQVHTELFDLTTEREMGHIRLARWADVLVVAPATADIMARFAHGICDNLLSTLFQARRGPVLLAPAMNTVMWEAPATQRNLQLLQQDGVHIVGPAAGDLACGETGAGRMSEPADIVAGMYPLLTEQSLAGQRWVINTGPTREAWDDVRTLSNRASGLLGSLIAGAAAMLGAEVQLIAGPGTPATNNVKQRRDVESAEDMLAACARAAVGADVFIASAAVSDYRFAEPYDGKLKRGAANGGNELTVQLLENADIVAYIAAMESRPEKIVAFAAEATDHVKHARGKLRAKGVDAIFSNDISRMGESYGSGW